jgi:hypothetical protein
MEEPLLGRYVSAFHGHATRASGPGPMLIREEVGHGRAPREQRRLAATGVREGEVSYHKATVEYHQEWDACGGRSHSCRAQRQVNAGEEGVPWNKGFSVAERYCKRASNDKAFVQLSPTDKALLLFPPTPLPKPGHLYRLG